LGQAVPEGLLEQELLQEAEQAQACFVSLHDVRFFLQFFLQLFSHQTLEFTSRIQGMYWGEIKVRGVFAK
jgi:hypothetical protein